MASRQQQIQEIFRKDATLLKDLAAGRVSAGVAPYIFEERVAKSLEASAHTAVAPMGALQSILRPLFAKSGMRAPTFGPHPDYRHLLGTTNTERGAVTTLFLDIANSTRLGLIYPLEVVYLLKNAVLCAAIEIVNAFDGHVHRLMGDAALAFFGGKGRRDEDGAIDAVNCATVLRYYVETVVIPALEDVGGLEAGIGIRIGVDHGPEDKVLWSAYGYPGNEEVTATSFHVDVASKLQHSAGRNQIMIGQRLRELLDFPSELLEDKTETADGNVRTVPYVRPNYSLADGTKLNYRQHVLLWEPYLATTGVAAFDPTRFSPACARPDACEVLVTVHASRAGASERTYGPSANMVQKSKYLRFAVRSFVPWLNGAAVTFCVENHGREAELAPDGKRGNHSTTEKLGVGPDAAVSWEPTAYRGLHFMTIAVNAGSGNAAGPIFQQRIGVYVE